MWATAAWLPASDEPLFRSTSGLRPRSSRATVRKRRGRWMLSRYITIPDVAGSAARYSSASHSSMSMALPSPMTRATPKCSVVRMRFMVWVQKLPVWVM